MHKFIWAVIAISVAMIILVIGYRIYLLWQS